MGSVKYLTLQLKDDLREEIFYNNHSFPFSMCVDCFDNYSGREWTSHWHDEYEFGLVLKGEVEFTVYTGGKNSVTVKLEKGDGIFIGSGFLHSVKATVPETIMAGYVFSSAFFNIRPFEAVLTDLIKPLTNQRISYLHFPKSLPDAAGIISTLDTLCNIPDDEPRYEIHCIELVFRLWRLVLDYASGFENDAAAETVDDIREQRLKRMVSFIRSNYNENINVDDIAKHALTSRTECFRCFKDVLRKTPTEYLTEYRLSMAGSLLATTKRSLTDIVFSCGFHSVSYFGKCFKEHYGVSPKKYRDNMNRHEKQK